MINRRDLLAIATIVGIIGVLGIGFFISQRAPSLIAVLADQAEPRNASPGYGGRFDDLWIAFCKAGADCIKVHGGSATAEKCHAGGAREIGRALYRYDSEQAGKYRQIPEGYAAAAWRCGTRKWEVI